jgi:hypothetical protein
MRRIVVIVGVAGLLGLAACSTSSGSGSDSVTPDPNDPSATTIVTSNPITGPAEQARNVVGQQNAQLQQEQQQTGG